MPNGDHRIPFLRPPSKQEKLEVSLGNLIDTVLAMHALNIAKGQYTHEELDRMAGIVGKIRPKLSETFTVKEGIKSIITAFRIETSGGKGKDGI